MTSGSLPPLRSMHRCPATHAPREPSPASPPPPRSPRSPVCGAGGAGAPTVPEARRAREHGRGGGQSDHRLPAPGHARRLADDADQLPRRPPARPSSDVKVVGSRSGSHTGRLEAYSTGTGESFLPATPFAQGEHGHASARASRQAAADVDRARPASRSPSSRRSARRSSPTTRQNRRRRAALPLGARRSRRRPCGSRRRRRAAPTPGDLFLAPYQGTGTPGDDDRRPGREPDLVPPGAGRTTPRRTSASSSTRASRC